MPQQLPRVNMEVLAEVQNRLPQADRDKAGRTSQQIHAFDEPFLYSTAEFTFTLDDQNKPHPIMSFIRTILRKPELGAYVGTLSCKGSPNLSPHKAPKVLVPQDVLRRAIALVRQTGLPYRDVWIEELHEGSLDAYLAILLVQLPRLRCLHLENVWAIETRLIGQVARTLLCRSQTDPHAPTVFTSLDQLETVHLDTPPTFPSVSKTVRNTENVLPFFYAPSLKQITVTLDNPLGPVLPWPTDPPLALGLTSLSLSNLREAHLGALLSVAPRLRSLDWYWYFEPDTEDQVNSPIVDLDLIMPALAPLKSTLAELSIVARCGYPNKVSAPVFRLKGSAKSLAGFNQLKTLLIPFPFLMGFTLPVRDRLASCLPPNLEDLTLTDDLICEFDDSPEWDEEGHTSAIRAWLADDVKASTPRLRKLLLVLGADDDEISSEALSIRNDIRELASREDTIEIKID